MNPIMMVAISFSKTKPTNLTILILSSSIATNILMNIQTNNKWFPLILTLLFSGGIMILFSFFSSTLPTPKPPKPKITLIPLLPLFLIYTSNKKMPNNISTPLAQSIYYIESPHLLLLTTMALLLTLNIKPQMIKTNSPLKSSH